MSVTFNVFRASKEGKIVADTTTRTLQNSEVYIEITHSGLCGTDEHFIRSEIVLGHEGVGIVKQTGTGVTSVKVGDRVGFGYFRKVCGACDHCTTGWDQYCRTARIYGECDFDIGTFSHGTVWDESCVFPIPESYSSEDAAPMMCAGSTVWNCLRQYGARAGDRIGIMGVGGLGHLAIKLASAIGCYVVVFSRTADKKSDAMDLGASEYYVVDPSKGMEKIPRLKQLLLCGSSSINYPAIVDIMDSNSIIFPLAVTFDQPPMPILPINLKGIRIQGSLVTSRQSLRELLEFAAQKKITATVVKYPLSIEGIETAMQDLRDGNVRYRAVLVRDLLPETKLA